MQQFSFCGARVCDPQQFAGQDASGLIWPIKAGCLLRINRAALRGKIGIIWNYEVESFRIDPEGNCSRLKFITANV
jgi:hypothetical protein